MVPQLFMSEISQTQGFFLVSRQERTLNMLFTKILLQALLFKPISPLQGL